jgi:spore maturation protein CgeB
MTRPTIAFFGSSLVSAYWNGAATYYRGIIRSLHTRGYRVTFYEPDAYERQAHRDIEDPDWAEVVVYPATADGVHEALERGRTADILVKTSGVGVFDELLDASVLAARRSTALAVYWDVDAPATLERIDRDRSDPFRALIPAYDAVLTYGGGNPVVEAYLSHGARTCLAVYNALDPSTHHPVPREPRFAADLAFLGNRLPDREARVSEFFLDVAAALPDRQFLLGGSGWQDRPRPLNVRHLGHVYTRDHNAFNVSPLAVLNISRDSMARCGFSPATRVFEAAGAGACLVTDSWPGIELFLEPSHEVLTAACGSDVAAILGELTKERAEALGRAARARVLRDHTYARRVDQLEAFFGLRDVA